ncbi:MAG: SDR family oxidoreductase [Frankiales bacterium]|nr:SDR family oxidoreductase [Frankiales bacterium]
MRVAIAGAHGQIGLILGRRLSEGGDTVVGLIRKPGQQDDLREAGVEPAVVDLESASVDEVAAALRGADAVVFAAGAGPGSDAGRKDGVDRAGAVLLADAAEAAGVGRYVLVSSMGVEQVRDGATPGGMEDAFVTYLRAKLAAEDDVRARPFAWTVLRPGALTDGAGTGQVRLAPSVPRGDVPRNDVADVIVALLHAPAGVGMVLELCSGGIAIEAAVASAR